MVDDDEEEDEEVKKDTTRYNILTKTEWVDKLEK